MNGNAMLRKDRQSAIHPEAYASGAGHLGSSFSISKGPCVYPNGGDCCRTSLLRRGERNGTFLTSLASIPAPGTFQVITCRDVRVGSAFRGPGAKIPSHNLPRCSEAESGQHGLPGSWPLFVGGGYVFIQGTTSPIRVFHLNGSRRSSQKVKCRPGSW